MRLSGMKMNCRKIPIIIFFVLVTAFISLYMLFFNHGPPEEIMKNNLQKTSNVKEEDPDDLTESEIKWRKFIKDNNYVCIGTVWDACEGDKDTIGKVVLLPNKETKGLKTRTFINITFDEEYDGGELGLSTQYNGKDLYDNKWDFCTIDEKEDEEDRQVFCPYKPGYHKWVTDRNIPKYLPKGTYTTKTWLTDKDGEKVACGFTEFVL